MSFFLYKLIIVICIELCYCYDYVAMRRIWRTYHFLYYMIYPIRMSCSSHIPKSSSSSCHQLDLLYDELHYPCNMLSTSCLFSSCSRKSVQSINQLPKSVVILYIYGVCHNSTQTVYVLVFM